MNQPNQPESAWAVARAVALTVAQIILCLAACAWLSRYLGF